MGNSTTSVLNVEHRVWEQGVTHENTTKIFNRENALTSYTLNEKLSFGKIDPDILKYLYDDNFHMISKGQNYVDGYRRKYSDPEECCTTNLSFIKKYNITLSCSNDTKTFNNDFCDDIMYKTCTGDGNSKCKAWIRAQVQRKGRHFTNLYKLALDEKLRAHEYVIAYAEALRDFATDSNNYNKMADDIINSYSDEIKYSEYKCAFPSFNIIEKEKNLKTPKECWYRDCALAPLYRLKLENIKKRELCNVTICDINIGALNISTQEIQIICKNKFNNQELDLSNTPIRQDIENFFFIPEFKNTILPFYLIFSLCFIFNK